MSVGINQRAEEKVTAQPQHKRTMEYNDHFKT